MTYKGKHDTWFFNGAKATYGVFDAAAVVEYSAIPPFTVDLADATHGLLALSQLYILGSTYYNGLTSILSLPDANSMVVYCDKYVAENLTTNALWKTMYSSPHPFEFLGFEVTLDAVCANTENLTITIDADWSSKFDNRIYTKAMNGVQWINNMFDEPRQCMGGDRVDIAWANAGSKGWGIKIFTRRTS